MFNLLPIEIKKILNIFIFCVQKISLEYIIIFWSGHIMNPKIIIIL